MSLPRILFIVPGLLAGLLIPAISAGPKGPPAGAIGMANETFAQSVSTIHQGERLTLVNSSRLVHIVGPGRGGQVLSSASGVPVAGFHLVQTNDVYRTEPWKTPGTYYLTCSVHPGMTLKVVVEL